MIRTPTAPILPRRRQMIKCKDKQRELHQQLLAGMPEAAYAASLQSLYGEFLVNHRERRVRQSLDLVKRLEHGVASADRNYHGRLEAFAEAKKRSATAPLRADRLAAARGLGSRLPNGPPLGPPRSRPRTVQWSLRGRHRRLRFRLGDEALPPSLTRPPYLSLPRRASSPSLPLAPTAACSVACSTHGPIQTRL